MHQDESIIEQHWLDDGIWRHDIFNGGSVHVPCLNFDLALDTVYEDISFEAS